MDTPQARYIGVYILLRMKNGGVHAFACSPSLYFSACAPIHERLVLRYNLYASCKDSNSFERL